MVDAKLTVNINNLLELPEGVHWHLTVGSSHIRLPEDKGKHFGIIKVRHMESSDGITQSPNAIKLDAGYRLTVNHRVNGERAGTVVNDQSQFVVRWLRNGMNGNNV